MALRRHAVGSVAKIRTVEGQRHGSEHSTRAAEALRATGLVQRSEAREYAVCLLLRRLLEHVHEGRRGRASEPVYLYAQSESSG